MPLQHASVRFAFTGCPLDRAFRFAHGAIAGSLAELKGVLATCPEWALQHHRHHFAPWVETVVGDLPLARRFRDQGQSDATPAVLRAALTGLLETRLAELQDPDATRGVPQRRLVRRRVG